MLLLKKIGQGSLGKSEVLYFKLTEFKIFVQESIVHTLKDADLHYMMN